MRSIIRGRISPRLAAVAVLALAGNLALATSLSAQSLFSTRGLGVPAEPLDARSRALGGIGVGLLGTNTSLINPAELGGVPRRGVSVVLQPTAHTQTLDDREASVSSSRFPLLSVMYPLTQRLLVGLGYGAYLEQSWGIRERGTQVIDDRSFEFEDEVRSTGGIGQIRVSAAYLLTPALSVGAMGGVITGNVDRTASRVFDDTTTTLRNFSSRVGWEYGGVFGGVGARYDLLPGLRVGASAMLTSAIDADSAIGSSAPRDYGAGYQLAAGASGRFSRDFTVTLGAIRQRFPEPKGNIDEGRATWTLGGGVEYEGLRSGRRVFPFRLGARYQQLPYHGVGEEPAKEISATAGLGLRLASDAAGPTAVVDIGLERARRTGLESPELAGGLKDTLWRWTISLALFGR